MTRENASGVLLSVLSEGAIYWREIAFNFNIEERLLLILIAKYQLFTSVWFHDFNSINVKSDLGKILDDTWADV